MGFIFMSYNNNNSNLENSLRLAKICNIKQLFVISNISH